MCCGGRHLVLVLVRFLRALFKIIPRPQSYQHLHTVQESGWSRATRVYYILGWGLRKVYLFLFRILANIWGSTRADFEWFPLSQYPPINFMTLSEIYLGTLTGWKNHQWPIGDFHLHVHIVNELMLIGDS